MNNLNMETYQFLSTIFYVFLSSSMTLICVRSVFRSTKAWSVIFAFVAGSWLTAFICHTIKLVKLMM